MSSPAVSVIVPVHNAAAWLEACLDSLLAQTLSSVEVILVDDASTDDSARICMAYKERHPEVFIYIRQERQSGPGVCRNVGMALARGEYIGFVDSDDIAAPDMYAALYAIAHREDMDIVVCGFLRLDSAGGSSAILPERPGKANPAGLFAQRKILPPVWNKLFKRAFLSRAGMCFPESSCAEDMAFVFLLLTEGPSVWVVAEPLYIYRHNPSSLTKDILHRISVIDSLIYIKNNLGRRKITTKYRYIFLKICLLHAVYYPMHLLLVRSLIYGENRSHNFKNFFRYAAACWKLLAG